MCSTGQQSVQKIILLCVLMKKELMILTIFNFQIPGILHLVYSVTHLVNGVTVDSVVAMAIQDIFQIA